MLKEYYFRLIESLDSPVVVKIINTILTILVVWLISIIAHKLINRNIRAIKTRYTWNKVTGYLRAFLIIFLVGRIWLEGIQSVATYFGLLSAGIAIALKDVITNIAGWIFILSRRPFEVGDRIQIGEFSGDVIDISLFQFTILEIGNWVDADQSTGRIVHVPNGKILVEELANFDKGFKYIWNEIKIVVTFESDWQKAKQVLLDIINKQEGNISQSMERQIKKAARKFMIYYKNLTPTVYTDVVDFGVRLTIRYLCETRRRRGTSEAIWESILTEFGKSADIDFAYPTQRFYNNLSEGKTKE